MVRFRSGPEEGRGREQNAPRGRSDNPTRDPKGPAQNPNIRVTRRRSDQSSYQDAPTPKRQKNPGQADRGNKGTRPTQEGTLPTLRAMSTRTKTAKIGEPPGLYTRPTQENIAPRTKDLVGILRRPKGAAERVGLNSPGAARRDQIPAEIPPKTWDPKTPIFPEHPSQTLETTEKSDSDFLGRGMGAIRGSKKDQDIETVPNHP